MRKLDVVHNPRSLGASDQNVAVPSDANQREIETVYTPRPTPYKRRIDVSPFADGISALGTERLGRLAELVDGRLIDDVSAALRSGLLTCQELVLYFVDLIISRDVDILNAIQELNPAALADAARIDDQIARGDVRGPLQGAVALIKDNIAAGPRMHTSAGAAVMCDAQPQQVADVVTSLTDAGVVILGKAAMSEWAYFLATPAPSGWSAVGGQIKNPHGLHVVGGSSTGSAVAVAAGLCSFAIGTETHGSITNPASASAVCGFKPSLGVVSTRGVLPLTSKHDVVGPIARCIDDVALVVEAIAPNLPRATEQPTLAGLRVGVHSKDLDRLARVSEQLQSAGAIVGIADFGEWDAEREIKIFDVLDYGMKNELADYLRATDGPVATLADVIEFNIQHPDAIPFGQDVIVKANANQLTAEQYDELAADNAQWASDKIQAFLDAGNFDVIASIGSSISGYYATAGLPAVCVAVPQELWAPADDLAPMSVTFISGKQNDAWLIELGRLVDRALATQI
jgi:amidase